MRLFGNNQPISKSRVEIGKETSMKKVMTAILSGTAMFMAAALTGADFRIDLQVKKNTCGLEFKGASEGLRRTRADWMKENADCRLMIRGKAGETWEEKSFQFASDEDCEVSINLMANPAGKKRPWIAYDNIRIDGAEIKNGSFEDVDLEKGSSKDWSHLGKAKYVLKTADDAADGKNYIEVTHDNRGIQLIKCEKGRTVTVTFMVRDAKRVKELK